MARLGSGGRDRRRVRAASARYGHGGGVSRFRHNPFGRRSLRRATVSVLRSGQIGCGGQVTNTETQAHGATKEQHSASLLLEKRVAVMQPYFFPYAGYFRLLMQTHEFVIFDCV